MSDVLSRRRAFRRLLSLALGLPLLGAIVAMLRREQARQAPQAVSIPADEPVGLSVVGTALVFRDAGAGLRAYSARCTHLGCRIDRVIGDEVVCPCHGSRFRADGSVAAGPATRPLARLQVEPDPKSGGWIARAS